MKLIKNITLTVLSLTLSVGAFASGIKYPYSSVFGPQLNFLDRENPKYTELKSIYLDENTENELSDLELQQILVATHAQTLEEAFENSEGADIYLTKFTYKGAPKESYVVIDYYPGGNPASAIFPSDSSVAVALAGDGDLEWIDEAHSAKAFLKYIGSVCGEMDPHVVGDACITYAQVVESYKDGVAELGQAVAFLEYTDDFDNSFAERRKNAARPYFKKDLNNMPKMKRSENREVLDLLEGLREQGIVPEAQELYAVDYFLID